jgi:arginyl-tRNA synthetase
MPPGPRRDALLAAVQATALAIAAALELLGIQRLEAM